MRKISAPTAWDLTKGDRRVVVGIIDTGVDCSHPDLAMNCVGNAGETGRDLLGRDKRTNGVDDDKNGYVDDFRGWDFANNDNYPFDDHGHGTHVSGTIGAVGNNGLGVTGVAWQVGIVGLKFLDASGSGTLEAAIRAIDYANMMNFPITNNSWGGGGYSQALSDAIAKGQAKGLLFVAAAGNESGNNDTDPAYPASYKLDNIVSVAATDSQDALAYFSNVGKMSVHLAAPGVQILSLLPGNRMGPMSGTSMATPHVSGVAALIKARYPTAKYPEIKRRLLQGVDKLPNLEPKTITGGRLNALKSLQLP
jgi:subtilisin family serine protease